jgi:hypothetical protein
MAGVAIASLHLISEVGDWKLSCEFWCLDDNSIKGLTSVLSVEHVLKVKPTGFNTSEQMW